MVSYLALEQEVIASSPKSECYCSRCDDEIEYGTPAMEILVGNIGDNGFQVAMEHGDLEFDPIYYHDECWMLTDEETAELFRDKPPCVDEESFLTCSMCGDGIRFDEQFGRVHPGMVVRSPFCPNGEQADDFEAHIDGRNTRVLCLSCLEATEINNGNEDDEEEEDEEDE